MQITTTTLTDGPTVIGVRVELHQADQIAQIGLAYVIGDESIEATTARALREAANWLDAGPVALRSTGGRHVARVGATADQPRWWRIAPPNGTPVYGYGTEADARRYCEHLDAGREIDLHTWEAADDFDESRRNDGFSLADELSATA